MRKFIPAILAVLMLAIGPAIAKPAPPPVKLFLSPASTVPSADILKNLGDRCPNVSLTLNSKESNFMLEAGGWPGHYRFTVFKKGGEAVYATQTQFLHNAVKDVCHYVNNAPK
jgi:hypothetical protein